MELTCTLDSGGTTHSLCQYVDNKISNLVKLSLIIHVITYLDTVLRRLFI